MASILDKYKGGTTEKKRSSILDKYREQEQYGYSQVDTSNAVPYRTEDTLVGESKDKSLGKVRLAGQEFEVTDYSDHPSRDIPVVGSALKMLDKVKEFTLPASKIAAELYTPGAGLANAA